MAYSREWNPYCASIAHPGHVCDSGRSVQRKRIARPSIPYLHIPEIEMIDEAADGDYLEGKAFDIIGIKISHKLQITLT